MKGKRHKGHGDSLGHSGDDCLIQTAFRARLEHQKNRKFQINREALKRKQDYLQNLCRVKETHQDELEYRHVLMDYNVVPNVQLKARMMTRREAYRRNASLRGLKYAWAMCGG